MQGILTILVAACSAIALGAAAQPTAAPDATPRSVERSVDGDRFAAGGAVRITTPVAGDLFGAGGTVEVDAPVDGDAVVAGGNVRLTGAVGASLYAAGGRLLVDGPVGRNARIAGGNVEIAERAAVRGNLTVGGGEVSLRGPVQGYVQVGGGSVFINGPVGGDVTATAGSVELGPEARISGRLRYASRDEIKRDPAAQIGGGIERTPIHRAGTGSDRGASEAVGRAGGWGWSIGLVAFAALLAALLPALAGRLGDTVCSRWPMSLLLGFVALVCIPVAALILLVTIIGAPLALVSIPLYLALLLLGYIAAGLALGVIALRALQPARDAITGWRVGAAALGMLAVTLLARLPVAGTIIVLLAMLIGMGALLLQLRRPGPA